MISTSSFKPRLAKIFRHWRDEDYDAALAAVEESQTSWPGNPQLSILWATLVQLQDNPVHGLDEVKKALHRAIELDKDSPAAATELGHFLDAVEDNPNAASKAFADAITSARRLLIDALLGQARALLQLEKRDNALRCVMEALYLVNCFSEADKSANGSPDIVVRDSTGGMQAFRLKGPFAMRIEDLLDELLPTRSA
jgi:tetratricopeptide (TPR) repeat protein